MRVFFYLIGFLATLVLTACVSSSTVSNSPAGESAESAPDLTEGSRINVELGVGYMRRGQYKVAKEKLEKAIDQNPENLQAYSTLALLMSKLNEKDQAEEYYLEAINIDSTNPWLHNSYGAFLCGADRLDDAMADRLDDAMEEFKMAYDDPFYETAYLARSNAGTCLLKSGKYKEAEVFLRRALRSDNKLSGALLSMAELGVKTQKYLMARAYIQRFHAVNQPTAESLWVQLQAEKALKDKKHYLKFSKQLLKDFPDSTEAGLLEDEMHKENVD